MNTIVLPGYSSKNKEWLDELRQKADIKPLDTIEWDHWKSENTNTNWINVRNVWINTGCFSNSFRHAIRSYRQKTCDYFWIIFIVNW